MNCKRVLFTIQFLFKALVGIVNTLIRCIYCFYHTYEYGFSITYTNLTFVNVSGPKTMYGRQNQNQGEARLGKCVYALRI